MSDLSEAEIGCRVVREDRLLGGGMNLLFLGDQAKPPPNSQAQLLDYVITSLNASLRIWLMVYIHSKPSLIHRAPSHLQGGIIIS